jgi:acyl-CoA reductase-like NAD-dependent aldehyde dehydrogenase
MKVVPTIDTPKLPQPKVDPHLQSAGERVKAAAEELERLGIADSEGKRIRTDLPKDMQDGADRDFGG